MTNGETVFLTNRENILVSGIVYDENKTPMPHLGIYSKLIKVGETDNNGNFSIMSHINARLVFRNEEEDDFESTEYYVTKGSNSSIEINFVKLTFIRESHMLGGAIAQSITIKKRTFFGRFFHSIGNWFR